MSHRSRERNARCGAERGYQEVCPRGERRQRDAHREVSLQNVKKCEMENEVTAENEASR